MADTEDTLRQTLKTIFADRELENSDIEIKALSSAGANYTTSIYKVTVTSANHETLNLFAKAASLPEPAREMMKQTLSVYETEIYFYTTLVPKYEELQSKYGFADDERFKFAKFYGCHEKYLEETVVLEDLTAKGLTLYDRLQPLDLAYTMKAVEELAKFHALSFAFKYEYPELYADYYPRFNFPMGKMITQIREFFGVITENLFEIIPENLKRRVQSFLEEQLSDEGTKKYFGPGKWEILLHGDYRASNIMHKTKGARVSSLVALDYQTLFLGSPSTDLLYLIYTGTDEALRRDHLPQLLDLYYGTLAKWLRQMNLDPEAVFSRKDFDEDYKSMLPFGLRTALFLLPIVLVEPEHAPSVTESSIEIDPSAFAIKPNDLHRDRLIPILYEFAQLGLL